MEYTMCTTQISSSSISAAEKGASASTLSKTQNQVCSHLIQILLYRFNAINHKLTRHLVPRIKSNMKNKTTLATHTSHGVNKSAIPAKTGLIDLGSHLKCESTWLKLTQTNYQFVSTTNSSQDSKVKMRISFDTQYIYENEICAVNRYENFMLEYAIGFRCTVLYCDRHSFYLLYKLVCPKNT